MTHDDLDRPGPAEIFNAWLDTQFNRLRVRPFKGTDAEALRGCVVMVASAPTVTTGDLTATVDQVDADLTAALRRVSCKLRRQEPERCARVAQPSAGVVLRSRAGEVR